MPGSALPGCAKPDSTVHDNCDWFIQITLGGHNKLIQGSVASMVLRMTSATRR